MAREAIGRIDCDKALYKKLLSCCRLSFGEIWEDKEKGHRVGVLDATKDAEEGL